MKKERKVLIWGIGNKTEELLKNGINAEIIGFIVSKKNNSVFRNKPVYEPNEIPREYDYILVATIYSDQIFEKCIECEIALDKVVFLYRGAKTFFLEKEDVKHILCEDNYKQYEQGYKSEDEIQRLYELVTGLLNKIEKYNEYGIINNIACEYNRIAFKELKACAQNKEIVICGAGPSLNRFNPIPNAIYIALNRALLFDKVEFDYFFADDWIGIQNYKDEIAKYSCKKYLGFHQIDDERTIPENFFTKCEAYKYYKDDYLRPNGFDSIFTCEVDRAPIGSMPNIALQVMQVALFMQPTKIYLVGCDATSNGHFVGTCQDSITMKNDLQNCVSSDRTISKWYELKKFADTHYHDTEIISINPIGLKGIFRDVYQE